MLFFLIFKVYSDLTRDLILSLFFFCSASGGHVEGNFSPHEAFAIGGTNSVRGYEEGAVGSGRSYSVGSGEVSFHMVRIAPLSSIRMVVDSQSKTCQMPF
jgi:outer membrane protein assembly factor BamA